MKNFILILTTYLPTILLLVGFFIICTGFFIVNTVAGVFSAGIELIIIAVLIQYGRE